MKNKQKQLAIIRERKEEMYKSKKKAFTIVELLTVMAIIAILIGLLVPALNLAMKYAKDTRQRAQFHSLSAALEMFKADDGDYPMSTAVSDNNSNTGFNATTNVTTGAQHLAEALVGRDLQGFDPMSTWNAYVDDTGANKQLIYASTAKGSDPCTQIVPSQDRRKGPYLTLQGVGAFCIDQLYGTPRQAASGIYSNSSAAPPQLSPVIADVYTTKSVAVGGKTVKAGTPVLYFKANSANRDLSMKTGNATYTRTYDYFDNAAILNLKSMITSAPHLLCDAAATSTGANTAKTFYTTISNPQINTNNENIAYNPDTYILMSAGNDGIFGTKDDIYNFGQ